MSVEVEPRSPPSASSGRSDEEEVDKTFRERMGDMCESAPAHLILMLLLLIDIIVIAMEFMIRATACDQAAADAGAGDDGLSDTQVSANHGLHTVSVTILVIFAIHLLVEIGAFGAEFFMNLSFVADFLVIGLALFFELSGWANEKGDLVTILLCSRVVRVAHAIHHTIVLQHEEKKLAVDEAVSTFENELSVKDRKLETSISQAKMLVEEVETIEHVVARVSDNMAKITADDPEVVGDMAVPEDLAAIEDVRKLQLMLTEERKVRGAIEAAALEELAQGG